ncbi:MAG: GNAT family N-acetyltransferase [Pseudomonadota bacterium]
MVNEKAAGRSERRGMKADLAIPAGRLRPISRVDIDQLENLLHEPDVRRFLCDDTCLPRKTIEDILETSSRLDCDGLGMWVIETRTQDFAGFVGLMPVGGTLADLPAMRGRIELTIAVRGRHWGQGIASSALSAVVDHARDDLNVSELVAAVDTPNARSHHLLQTCGFRNIGTAPGPVHLLVLYRFSARQSEQASTHGTRSEPSRSLRDVTLPRQAETGVYWERSTKDE